MVSASFRLFRSRHPLARLALGLLGIVVVGAFLALSVFALAALLVGGAAFVLVGKLRRLFDPQRGARPRPAQASARPAPVADGVIEGEYTVVQASARSNR